MASALLASCTQSWNANGRFHGGWWQQINSKWRSRVFINDTPTIEVDYRGLHVSILSAEDGVDLGGDPYALPRNTVPGTPEDLQRKLVKRLVLTAINAPSRESAYRSFRGDFPTGHMAKTMTNAVLERLLAVFTANNPHLEPHLFADEGIRLMNVDSRIAEQVHRHFTQQGVPVLSVHDSFIVDYTRAGELKTVLAQASEAVVGRSLPTTGPVGLDEVSQDPDHPVLDYVSWKQLARSQGYLDRLAAHETRTGQEVVPYALPADE